MPCQLKKNKTLNWKRGTEKWNMEIHFTYGKSGGSNADLITPAYMARMDRITQARNTKASLFTYLTPTNTTIAIMAIMHVP